MNVPFAVEDSEVFEDIFLHVMTCLPFLYTDNQSN